jgi:hypothetical protein
MHCARSGFEFDVRTEHEQRIAILERVAHGGTLELRTLGRREEFG